MTIAFSPASDMSALDLDVGDPERAERIAARADEIEKERNKRTTGRRPDTSKGKSTSTSRATAARSAAAKAETELLSRLERTFDRIVSALQDRDDVELATVIEEDKEAMSRGLVSVTRTVSWLRSPLIMSLNLVEPVLAFGRVTRILFLRFVERRQRILTEQQMQQQAQNQAAAQPEVATPWYDNN